MLRRYIVSSVVMTALLAVLTGLLYPLAVYGIGRVTFPHRADGSFIKNSKGQLVGSSLLGQNFLDKDGNPDPRYFQPRPSAAGSGYDAAVSSATNLGPGDPRLVGFIPGFNSVGLDGNSSTTNPFATKDDPYCVPTDDTGAAVTSPASDTKYAKNKDGSYACYSSTVPERASAYRQLNNLDANAPLPVDAVTASGSGLDPDISVANADLQVARVARARNLSTQTVLDLVKAHTNARQWGFLGEKTINVLDLNLALDNLHP
jgi:K+-transporting ATPase ATPase C chain